MEVGIILDHNGGHGGLGTKFYISQAMKQVDIDVLSSKQMAIQGALRVGNTTLKY